MKLYSAKTFYIMSFTFAIIGIMIKLVGFLKTFAVCIAIKTITNFPIWDFHLIFRILSYSVFYLFVIFQSRIYFSPLPNVVTYFWVSTP